MTARIGDNNGPPIDPTEFDQDFISARFIKRGAEFLQFAFREHPELERMLIKRSGSRPMAYRLVLGYSLRGLAPLESMARVFSLNRKTFGENVQRLEVWINHDSEEGRALDAILEDVCEATYRYAKLDGQAFDDLIMHFVRLDPQLRAAEKAARAAALAAERAALALEEKTEARRIRAAGALRSKLKGVENPDAIIAQQRGARHTAQAISPQALATVELLVKAEIKGARRLTSELNPAGLAECIRFGLAASAEPALSNAKDPKVRSTDFAMRVFHEAIGLDLISKPKRKAAR